MNRYERVLGGLFGVACGDALGGTLEFLSKEDGRLKYGYLKDITGGGVWDLTPGETTDDTAMTLALAEGILENPKAPLPSIGNKFIEWYKTDPKDVGNIISLALDEYIHCHNWLSASYYAHKASNNMSAGNGALMRCIPVALYYEKLDEVIEITKKQSYLTHYDRLSAEACVLYNTLVFEYMDNKDKIPVLNKILKGYHTYQKVFEITIDDLKPSGYVVDTLTCALWCFINTNTFEDAVCTAVNLCGDADTVGAITGGLSGVYYGYDSIPESWKEKILLKDKILDIGSRLTNTVYSL